MVAQMRLRVVVAQMRLRVVAAQMRLKVSDGQKMSRTGVGLLSCWLGFFSDTRLVHACCSWISMSSNADMMDRS